MTYSFAALFQEVEERQRAELEAQRWAKDAHVVAAAVIERWAGEGMGGVLFEVAEERRRVVQQFRGCLVRRCVAGNTGDDLLCDYHRDLAAEGERVWGFGWPVPPDDLLASVYYQYLEG